MPDDYPSLSEALADGHPHDALHLQIAADYEEPMHGCDVIQLNVRAPITLEGEGESRAILSKGLALERFEEPAIEVRLRKLSLRGLTAAGFLILRLDDCELDGQLYPSVSIDVREHVELHMVKCDVRHCNLGLRVHFPAKAYVQAAFVRNRIGLALLNNPQVHALESTFVENAWANATLQCRWSDGPILLQPELPEMELVDVAVDGPWGCITYKKWPLPTEQQVVTRRKRTPIVVDVSPRVIHCDHERSSIAYHPRRKDGSSWAREVLGLLHNDIDGRALGQAYRKRARQVHPDKTDDNGSVAFLRLKAAYDVLRQEMKKPRKNC